MSDLWQTQRAERRRSAEPLAVRMRPRTLDEFAGQAHILGEGKLLRRMLTADRITSVVFYGPPGTGKTTLAELIARHTHRRFERANASAVGVKEVRTILDDARRALEGDNQRTILFLDEIHRFNRAQQDVLLGDVERGIVTLIGATTENPFFAINSPLISRSQIFEFQPLNHDDIVRVLKQAIVDSDRGFGKLNLDITDEALNHWATMCDGDARRALTALEIAVLSTSSSAAHVSSSSRDTPHVAAGPSTARSSPTGDDAEHDRADDAPDRAADSPADTRQANTSHAAPIVIDLAIAQESVQKKAIVYDGTGDEHYDAASALIKSMRGSDPDAAIYWTAKMLVAGEDPRFIARRVAIFASEDIGNADPRALTVAAAAFEITERVGMPECQLTLGQAVIYMATAPKSNASATAIWTAMKEVREGRTIPIPRHLRDGHYKGAKRLGNAEGYQYPHDSKTGVVDQEYLGVDRTYYTPTDRGHEQRIAQYLEWVRGQRMPEGPRDMVEPS